MRKHHKKFTNLNYLVPGTENNKEFKSVNQCW